MSRRITVFCYLPGPGQTPPDRLYLDQSVPCEPAAELTRCGIHTVTAESEGLADASTTEQLLHAAKEGRMFVTRVLPLTRYWRKPHAGVLVVSGSVTSSDLVHHLTTWPLLLAFPPGVQVHSVPPLAKFFESLHSDKPFSVG